MASPGTRDRERPSLTLRRHFDVAPDKVWRAWTEPQALKQWFGPAEIVPFAIVGQHQHAKAPAHAHVELGDRHRDAK
jgi:uncharacterized protein YndB with AHSA1/START domain